MMDEEKDDNAPRKKKRAGFTTNKGRGTPKSKRKMIQASKRRNRRK